MTTMTIPLLSGVATITWVDYSCIITSLRLLARRPRGTTIYEAISDSVVPLYVKHEQRPGSYCQERDALLRLRDDENTGVFLPVPRLFGYSDEGQYLVMEKVNGKHLDSFYFGTAAPSRQRYDIALRLLEAFEWVHGRGIAHFDTHHENIFYDAGRQQVRLIDFGSCGIGETIKAVRLAKLRSPLCESKKRFYRAYELTKSMVVDGELAERYGIASQIYSLVWGMVPLDAAYPDRGDYVEVDTLRKLTVTLPHYNEERHRRLLGAVLANLHPMFPSARRHDTTEMKQYLYEALL